MARFKVVIWTKIVPTNGPAYDMYAVLMPDGSPCAFGGIAAMTEYAARCNQGGCLAKEDQQDCSFCANTGRLRDTVTKEIGMGIPCPNCKKGQAL